MASRTPYALRNVDAVVKIRIFRQVVNAFPFDRLVIAKAGPDRFKVRAVGPDLTVAVHTGLCRRHPCRRGRLYRLVAISAIDTVVTDVMLVAELNRLLLFDVTAR